jgi:hypothetical protein
MELWICIKHLPMYPLMPEMVRGTSSAPASEVSATDSSLLNCILSIEHTTDVKYREKRQAYICCISYIIRYT